MSRPAAPSRSARARSTSTTGLSLDVDDVTIQGAGHGSTILSFANQTDGAQGLYVTAQHGFTMHDLAVEDTQGDALKLLGTTKVTISKTRVEWTKGANETNGSYGLYPVQCADVLIEDNVVKGASDSGVYVGQSDMIVVKNNQRRAQRRRHRDRELDARRRPRQHRDEEHRRHPRVQPARPRRSRTARSRACSTTRCSRTTPRTSRPRATSSGSCRPAPASRSSPRTRSRSSTTTSTITSRSTSASSAT